MLWERVVRYVNNGGSKAFASRKFEVSVWCVNDWCQRESLAPKKHGRRKGKLDWDALKEDVRRYRDKLLRERAATFGVYINAIDYALKQMKITSKKTFKYSQRDPEKRIVYLQKLRSIIEDRGSDNIVYIDESGFNEKTHSTHAWSKRGKKIYGDRSGARKARINLIAANRKNDLLAPILYEGSTCATWFNDWLRNHLMKTLAPKSTLILDNAAIHKKDEIKVITHEFGHEVLFLPPYSPDLNPIEQDFAIMKKRRMFAKPGTTIDEIVKSYGVI